MKRLIILLLVLSGFQTTAEAQNLDDYKYISVPEKFEFLSDENQYQLNELTAFLFDKYGFNVLYKENKSGAEPCEILRAEVEDRSGFLQSKVMVHLRDCQNEVVFSSQLGKSREKDRKVAYHEALREAFKSFEELEFSYAPAEVIVQAVVPAEEKKQVTAAAEEQNQLEPGSKTGEFARFVNGNTVYILKKAASGYSMFRDGEENRFAVLLKSAGGDNYLFSSEKLQGNAFFDPNGDLIVEYLDPVNDGLHSIKYLKQD